MHGGQHHQWVEFLHHHLGAAVGEAVHRGEHHAEAVEERYADAQLVVLREFHVLAGDEAVVGDVVMREHDAFGEARGAGGVLHVDHVVAGHVLLHLIQHVVVDVLSQEEQFGGVEHPAIFLPADEHHVLHAWEAFALQMPALAVA